MELRTSSLRLVVPIVVAGLATLRGFMIHTSTWVLQAMREKLKMTPATRNVLDTNQKTAISAEKFEGITENQSLQQLYRDGCRKCVKEEHSKLDEKTVDQIVDEMERMPQLLRDAYRKRFQERRPQPLDEATMEDHLNWIPMPPLRIVEIALVERMHLPKEVRMQQVAILMVDKYLLPSWSGLRDRPL